MSPFEEAFRMKKVQCFALFLLPAIALSSCGGFGDHASSSSALSYYVEPQLTRYNTVSFASDFDDTQFVITDSNNLKEIPVTSSMVSGFDSKQLLFDTNLKAKVSYQNMSLDLTYQISSVYTLPEQCELRLLADQSIEIYSLNLEMESGATYTIPDTISALPSPLNTWPVRVFSASFLADNLLTLQLGKYVTSIESSLGHFAQVLPAQGGALQYADGFLLDKKGTTLLGLFKDLQGEVTLPASVVTLPQYAFATPNSLVSKITVSSGVTAALSIGNAIYNLSALTGFSVSEENKCFLADEQGVLYGVTSYGNVAIAAPMVRNFTIADPLVLSNTSTTSPLDFLYRHTNVLAVTLAQKALYFSANVELKGLEQITLPNPNKVVKPSGVSLSFFSDKISFKVPSSLLSDYQNDDAWKGVKDRISAID